MPRRYRCCWYDPDARTADVPGHPLYVYPRQGAGRVDDPEHEYRVLYVAAEAAGCVAEAFGDFAVWTQALLDPPPSLPGAFRAIIEYDVDAGVCDFDDPARLVEFALRPSQVVSHDRRRTQQWARRVYDTGRFDGVSWWSRRDARWTSIGLWRHEAVAVEDVTSLIDMRVAAITDAAAVLLRRINP